MMKIKKIGRIWATEKTVKRSSLQNYIVEKLDLNQVTPMVVKKKSVEYHVYGKNKQEYKDLMEKIKSNLQHRGTNKNEI